MNIIFFILDYQIMICVIRVITVISIQLFLLTSVEKYGYQAITSVKHVPEQTVLPVVLNLNH